MKDKDKAIDNACMMLGKAYADIDLTTVRNILTLALRDYDVRKQTQAVTIYEGNEDEEIIKAFLVAKRVAGSSDKTIEHYAFILQQFLKKTQKHILKVTANDVRIYFARRELDDKVSAVTRNNERSVLSSLYQWLTDEELIDRNPVRKVPKIKERKMQKKAFSKLELEKIRSHCQNVTETAIIETLISTGCRVSELCGIKVSDIDGDRVTVHGKGNKDRVCYLTAKAQIAIDEYMQSDYFKIRQARGSDYLFMRKRYEGDEYKKSLSTAAVEAMAKRIGKRAGVTNVHPHRFRRTCATHALERGMPIERVSYMLGHESIETTQVYLDITEEGMHDAHRRFVS